MPVTPHLIKSNHHNIMFKLLSVWEIRVIVNHIKLKWSSFYTKIRNDYKVALISTYSYNYEYI